MTAIFDVLVNTDDIVVLGSPTQIDVNVDIGPEGQRGAKFFVGSGDPNVISLPEAPILGDFFINSSTASDYGWLYVYTQDVSNTNVWQAALRLQPAIYSKNIDATFDSSGLSTIQVALSDIISDVTITDSDRYIVQVMPIHSNPVSVVVNSKNISGGNISINLEAIEYSSSNWQELQGVVKIGVTISVV